MKRSVMEPRPGNGHHHLGGAEMPPPMLFSATMDKQELDRLFDDTGLNRRPTPPTSAAVSDEVSALFDESKSPASAPRVSAAAPQTPAKIPTRSGATAKSGGWNPLLPALKPTGQAEEQARPSKTLAADKPRAATAPLPLRTLRPSGPTAPAPARSKPHRPPPPGAVVLAPRKSTTSATTPVDAALAGSTTTSTAPATATTLPRVGPPPTATLPLPRIEATPASVRATEPAAAAAEPEPIPLVVKKKPAAKAVEAAPEPTLAANPSGAVEQEAVKQRAEQTGPLPIAPGTDGAPRWAEAPQVQGFAPAAEGEHERTVRAKVAATGGRRTVFWVTLAYLAGIATGALPLLWLHDSTATTADVAPAAATPLTDARSRPLTAPLSDDDGPEAAVQNETGDPTGETARVPEPDMSSPAEGPTSETVAPAPTPPASGYTRAAAQAAGLKAATTIQACLPTRKIPSYKVSAYLTPAGTVRRVFITGASPLDQATVRCVRAKLTGQILPLTPPKTSFAGWRMAFRGSDPIIQLIRPTDLRK